jgi:hypothetical protein
MDANDASYALGHRDNKNPPWELMVDYLGQDGWKKAPEGSHTLAWAPESDLCLCRRWQR